MKDWRLFHGDGKQRYSLTTETEESDQEKKILDKKFPVPPPWRNFHKINKNEQDEINKRWTEIQKLAESEENQRGRERGEKFRIHVEKAGSGEEKITEAGQEVINAVNAALYLRRPLLVTGNPGSGKTSLAYAIAYELKLGSVLTWSITARSTLQDGLYRYDAIGRLQEAEKKEDQSIGDYITLGALGTAFLPSPLPRVLLIDEIDKSDINLPNDLLHIFEEGGFNIPELVRRVKDTENKTKPEKETNAEEVFTSDGEIKATIRRGRVRCAEFPIIIMTSNGEREFPPAFLRRCLRVKMPDPQGEALKRIVKSHFGEDKFDQAETEISKLIVEFEQEKNRSTDQLLNAIYLLTDHVSPEDLNKDGLRDLLFKSLSISDEL
jgi:MoxR-like ATPase